jgi:uncharacterized membrane protein
MVGLGDLPGGIVGARGYSASKNASVIVGSGVSSNGIEAFRWTAGEDMVGLGDLPGGGFFSEAYGVSADGLVVVGRSAGRNPFTYSAFRWTAQTGMVEIPPISGNLLTVTAEAISGDGNVIVGGTVGGDHAFVWDQFHGTRDLNSLLVEQGVDLGGWTLRIARGVSYDGLTITVEGLPPDRQRFQPCLVTLDPGTFIPEPSSLTLCALSATVLILIAWRLCGA